MTAGRRTRLTESVQAKIVLALSSGHYLQDAASAAGIAPSTLKSWLADARAIRDGAARPSGQRQPGKGALLDLLDAVEATEYHAAELGLSAVRKAAESGDWHAGAWFLQHRFPKTWGQDQDVTPPPRDPKARTLIDIARERTEAERDGKGRRPTQ